MRNVEALRLRARVERLEAALSELVKRVEDPDLVRDVPGAWIMLGAALNNAREALRS